MGNPFDTHNAGFLPREIREALNREVDTKDNTSYGELSMDSPSTFDITQANVWRIVPNWNEPGLFNNVTVDVGDKLTIHITGVYMISAELSFKGQAADYQVAVFRNGSILHNIHASATVNAGAYRNIALSGLVQLYANDIVELYIQATATGTVTPEHGTLLAIGIFQP